MVLPALALGYLWAGPSGLGKRVWQLLAGAVASWGRGPGIRDGRARRGFGGGCAFGGSGGITRFPSASLRTT